MKKITTLITVLTLLFSLCASSALAERKNQPKPQFVEEALEALGGEHFPEDMRVKRIISIEIGETYYHVYSGKITGTQYHVIIYDNYENYLGYYESAYPPSNYQIEGAIAIDPSEVDSNGDQIYYSIPIDPQKGLPQKIQLGTTTSSFVKGPEISKEENGPQAGAGGVIPEYRDWNIRHKGKVLEVRALYLSQTFAKVTLRGEATGNEREFDITDLSKEDQEYINQFK